ncbi:MAG TPA: type II toxin-antitoxin system HicA family toxin [Rhizomicrobium sp.]|nr:type II toxin-antitoxin system HicA family toxin [Rhizomicrobium sp.]
MKLPRNVGGADLVKALRALGYERTRQEGSHIRLTTERSGAHHITVPNHSPIKLGTLSAILKAVAAHHRMSVEELVRLLGL